MEDRIKQLEEALAKAIERIELLEDQIKFVMAGVHGLDKRTIGLVKLGGLLNYKTTDWKG